MPENLVDVSTFTWHDGERAPRPFARGWCDRREGEEDMSYAAKILADSIAFGCRLVTFEVTFPRFILAEFNTHRALTPHAEADA